MRSDGELEPPGRRLRVLVVGTDDWAVDQAAALLEAAGHVARRCHDTGRPAFPCHRFSGGSCPVEAGVDVVLTVRGRVSSEPAAGELGVICGLRGGLPLVVAGFASSNPYSAVAAATVAPGQDLVSACEAAIPRVIDLRSADDQPHVARLHAEADRSGAGLTPGLP